MVVEEAKVGRSPKELFEAFGRRRWKLAIDKVKCSDAILFKIVDNRYCEESAGIPILDFAMQTDLHPKRLYTMLVLIGGHVRLQAAKLPLHWSQRLPNTRIS